MASTLTIKGCDVTTTSITISFSAPVDVRATDTGAANPDNYTIYDPAANFFVPTNPDTTWGVVPSADGQTVVITLPTNTSFNTGDFVLIGISNIALASDPGTSALIDDPVSISRQVPGTDQTARTTKDVEDAIAYPVLTEEIGYRPSPVGTPTTGGGGAPGGGPLSLGQVAMKAVSDVLGWKANAADPKGFVGALTQSFTLTDVEGHVESTWTPRTYTVQTDLGGGITGAQASLYTRAKDALDMSLSLLDGLYPLDPEADPEYVKALREMTRSQMTEIVKELGVVGLPSILRIDTYFGILLGQNPAQLITSSTSVQFDPDQIEGTLGTLRDTYGIYFIGNRFNNSVEDEQDITNFRVISDYMTSLMQSWIANRQFFIVQPNQLAFFGTQLVLISRQFNVIAETVNEVRFTLDSVFIGPNERQTLLLEFADGSAPMFLEDVLDEVESFATGEGPRLLRDGGRISVTNNILPVVQSLQNLVEQAHAPTNVNDLPDGFRTARVRNSLDDLQDQLEELINLTQQVEQNVPPAEDKLTISSVSIPQSDDLGNFRFSIFGDGFDPATVVTINSSPASGIATSVEFYSEQRIDASFNPASASLSQGDHDVTATNSAGESSTFSNAFFYNGTGAFSAAMKRPRLPTNVAGMSGTTNRTAAPLPKVVGPTRAVRPPSPAAAANVTAVGGKGSPPPTPPTGTKAPAADVSSLHERIDKLETMLKNFLESKSRDKKDKDKDG
jgi:hypothetical protein